MTKMTMQMLHTFSLVLQYIDMAEGLAHRTCNWRITNQVRVWTLSGIPFYLVMNKKLILNAKYWLVQKNFDNDFKSFKAKINLYRLQIVRTVKFCWKSNQFWLFNLTDYSFLCKILHLVKKEKMNLTKERLLKKLLRCRCTSKKWFYL